MKMISVIIPVHNGEKWIDRCAKSIINQTIFEDLEVIFVENGSTDQSGRILRGYCDKYSNLCCLQITQKGVSNARNKGLEIARCQYIAFIDADDYIEKTYFENLLNAFDENIDVVAGGYKAVYSENHYVFHGVSELKIYAKEQALIEFLKEKDIDPCVCGKIFRREIIGTLQFDADLIVSEDRWFLYQLFKAGCMIKCIPTGQYHYIMNDESVCRNTFSPKNWQALKVYKNILDDVCKSNSDIKEVAECAYIDMECRLLGELEYFCVKDCYEEQYRALLQDVRKFSLKKKLRHSSKKHFVAFIIMRISPHLYSFIKNNLKMQYR